MEIYKKSFWLGGGYSSQLNTVDTIQNTTSEFTCLDFETGDNQMAVLQQEYSYLCWAKRLRVDKTRLSAFIQR